MKINFGFLLAQCCSFYTHKLNTFLCNEELQSSAGGPGIHKDRRKTMCQQNEKAAECKSRIEETNLASSLVLDIQVLSLSLFLSLSFCFLSLYIHWRLEPWFLQYQSTVQSAGPSDGRVYVTVTQQRCQAIPRAPNRPPLLAYPENQNHVLSNFVGFGGGGRSQ